MGVAIITVLTLQNIIAKYQISDLVPRKDQALGMVWTQVTV